MPTHSLYATGFNAHNQLSPSTTDHLVFRKILSGNKIRIHSALWSCTVLSVDESLLLLGNQSLLPIPITGLPASDIKTIVGSTTAGPLLALTTTGKIYTFTLETHSFTPHTFPPNHFLTQNSLTPTHLALAGNDTLAIATSPTPTNTPLSTNPQTSTLHTYPTLRLFLTSPSPPPQSHPLPDPLTSLSASTTSFTALTTPGTLYTWTTNPLHPHIGRTPPPPLTTPSPITSLGGIPIRQIAAGGWITAALSTEHDLYIWGGRPGEERSVDGLPTGAEEEVHLVDFEGGREVRDVGVGDGHLVLVGEGGGVWCCGEGAEGQLGCGMRGWRGQWGEVRGLEGRRVSRVWGGGWGSWALVEGE
ncbi:hypothetical protein MMC12_007673 [Toensbergia leucococca]|nr:hypothetical protein [Toensbergia leucococca]